VVQFRVSRHHSCHGIRRFNLTRRKRHTIDNHIYARE
jgi:hypothetical protein